LVSTKFSRQGQFIEFFYMHLKLASLSILALNTIRNSLGIIVVAAHLFMPLQRAIAQVADVPNPNRNGDYTTAFLPGNRGHYPIRNWLVVEVDPTNQNAELNCRNTPNGRIRSRIPRGAILQSAFRGPANESGRTTPNPDNDAIVMHQGLPWLRIRGTKDEMAFPENRDWKTLGECYVRANLQYIAPINPDAKLIGR
jgi:hypothetical protein